jgi:membrane-associated protease RseP (regulator of RpoE activity)
MTILGCHEAGHFLQARRYGVYSSFPYFIPMPLSPIGTFGAVIGMDSRVADRKALFDIGISGPLAGLVPTLVFCIMGMQYAETRYIPPNALGVMEYGDPLLLRFLAGLFFPSASHGEQVILNPMLFAGWVGLLITSLNLIPIGQLDGGHILYGLLRKRAHAVATFLLLAAVVAVVAFGYYWWSLMLVLLAMMGPKHPPTANDNVPLGTWRTILGWLTLAFIFIGFTPTPIVQ